MNQTQCDVIESNDDLIGTNEECSDHVKQKSKSNGGITDSLVAIENTVVTTITPSTTMPTKRPKQAEVTFDVELMTTDAQPPNSSVLARVMQRRRTLAEKQMILQQQNEIGLSAIEDESTHYHELRKRSKLDESYHNTLMQSIQDENIPFARDCWRATCYLTTQNKKFAYQTIVYEEEEIRLVGSRGNNEEKIAFNLNEDSKRPRYSKRTLDDCPSRCLPINGIRINNIDTNDPLELAQLPTAQSEACENQEKNVWQKHVELLDTISVECASISTEMIDSVTIDTNFMEIEPDIDLSKHSATKRKLFANDAACVDDTEMESIFESKRRRQAEESNLPNQHCPIAYQRRCDLLKSLQHVRVELNRLPDLDVEPWCMVHCLYKCHCKGRAPNGHICNRTNKKNDMTEPGDDKLNTDESARTSLLDWTIKPRPSVNELKALRNECSFIETPLCELLDERINQCRKYNQAKNILQQLMESGQLDLNAHGKADDEPTNETPENFETLITNMMQGLSALQERKNVALNPTPNELSIMPWDQIVHEFNVSNVFIWNIILENDLQQLALTTHREPKWEHHLQATNINETDINSLPTNAKLIRNGYKTKKTKYRGNLVISSFVFYFKQRIEFS